MEIGSSSIEEAAQQTCHGCTDQKHPRHGMDTKRHEHASTRCGACHLYDTQHEPEPTPEENTGRVFSIHDSDDRRECRVKAAYGDAERETLSPSSPAAPPTRRESLGKARHAPGGMPATSLLLSPLHATGQENPSADVATE